MFKKVLCSLNRSLTTTHNFMNRSLTTTHNFTNNLIHESSPYLLQHAHNPVDWFPWGEEALKIATDEEKLIFLSIGYSTCHWCHVMEAESFEDEEIAEYLNDHYVCIKVDREERPDLDHLYMDMAMCTGTSAGWPLSIWMSPRKEPIFFGTYLPPKKSEKIVYPGTPFFIDVCKAIAETWNTEPNDVLSIGEQITLQYELIQARQFSEDHLGFLRTPEERVNILNSFFTDRKESFDEKYGGFEQAPKFPCPHTMSSMLRLLCSGEISLYDDDPTKSGEISNEARGMVKKTLAGILEGGIHDQIWGGFHRYSVDEKWLVPHFEKMLYDQAGMVNLLIDAAILIPEERELYMKAAQDCIEMVCRDMMDNDSFLSSIDADDAESGEEGLWYLWEPDEIIAVLGEEDGKKACQAWGVTESGNFEGKNILSLVESSEGTVTFLRENDCVSKMREYREEENTVKKPFVDSKILRDWNGYMIGAISRMAMLCSGEAKEQYLNIAASVADKLLVDQEIVHCEGIDAFSADYGFMIDAIATLYEATFDPKWKKVVLELSEKVIEEYFDENKQLFAMSSLKSKGGVDFVYETLDGAMPSTNSILARGLIRAGTILEREEIILVGVQVLDTLSSYISDFPSSFSLALDAYAEWSFENDRKLISFPSDWEDTVKELLSGKVNFGSCVSILPVTGEEQEYFQICSGKKCSRVEVSEENDMVCQIKRFL